MLMEAELQQNPGEIQKNLCHGAEIRMGGTSEKGEWDETAAAHSY